MYGKFKLTDDDCFQYVMTLNEKKFVCIQMDEIPDEPDPFYVVRLQEINLEDYEEESIEKYVTGYYESIDAVFKQYGNDMNQIIAECIFEQQTEFYADFAVSVKSEGAANAEIQRLIRTYEALAVQTHDTDSTGNLVYDLITEAEAKKIIRNEAAQHATDVLKMYASEDEYNKIVSSTDLMSKYVEARKMMRRENNPKEEQELLRNFAEENR